MTYDIIIIGGGAAGYAASSLIQGRNSEGSVTSSPHFPPHVIKTLIIERNPLPMRKLSLTGKGRCNVTNNCDIETVLSNIIDPSKSKSKANFIRSALTRFTPADTIAFFGGLGVPLKTERGGRVFPVSDRSADIVDALRRACTAETVTDRAAELILADGEVTGVKGEKSDYFAKNVIVATGGLSYPATGSTGDGYALARQAGHTVTPLRPALVPLETQQDVSKMAGLSLKNIAVKAGKFNQRGEMLFTRFGVSGPLILTASCFITDFPQPLTIDLKPALDIKTLDSRILREFAQNKNRRFKNALTGLLPKTMIDTFAEFTGINPEKQVNEVTKEERAKTVELFKAFPLTVTSARPIDEAVITDGGVALTEIDPRTMQSKRVKGLYFIGEVLDIAALTGGFNLQLAFSAACAAADACL